MISALPRSEIHYIGKLSASVEAREYKETGTHHAHRGTFGQKANAIYPLPPRCNLRNGLDIMLEPGMRFWLSRAISGRNSRLSKFFSLFLLLKTGMTSTEYAL